MAHEQEEKQLYGRAAAQHAERDSWCRWGRRVNKMLLKRSRTNKSKLLPEGRRYKVLGEENSTGAGLSCLLYVSLVVHTVIFMQ